MKFNNFEEMERYAVNLIQSYRKKHKSEKEFIAFSGGGDSLLTCLVVKKFFPNVGIFHADTGIGLKSTKKYIDDVCKKMGWNITVITAEETGSSYEKMVMKFGFPGGSNHNIMYTRLKGKPIAELHRRFKGKRGNKITLFTGIRSAESERRKQYYTDKEIEKRRGIIWVNPVFHVSNQMKHDYIKSFGLEMSDAHKKIGISGECLCGAFAHKGELELIRLVEPETAEYIEQLEKKVKNNFPWGWEDSPPDWYHMERKGQVNLFHGAKFCRGCEKSGGNND